MTTNKRLERIEHKPEIVRKRAARFWAQFSTPELELMASGDTAMIEKAERLGASEILRQERAHFTPTERAAYESALAEIMQAQNVGKCWHFAPSKLDKT